MPTGYTADIKKGITFKEFAMNCARAFGACITLRDNPEKPIPEKFNPSNWHMKESQQAQAELHRISDLTNEQCQEEAEKEFKRLQKEHNKYIKNKLELRSKYEDMLLQVKRWQPPSDNHIEYKNFMIDQIVKSIEFDCSTKYDDDFAPKPLSGSEWKSQKISSLNRDITYHGKNFKEELERVEKRNLWIKQLRESL